MARVNSEDVMLQHRLRAACERGVVTIYTDPTRLNASGSPVFDPWENILPLLALLLVSMFLMLYTLIGGVVALLVMVGAYLFLVRPWIIERVRNRATRQMLVSVEYLDRIWAWGGVALTRADNPAIGAMAPSGSWRLFARRHLPEVVLPESLGGELKGRAGWEDDQ